MLSKAIYKALWVFLILSDSICGFIHTIALYIYWQCTKVYYSLIVGHPQQEDIQYLEECKKYFKKIPKHLNVIIPSKNVSANALSNIAFYALILDIDYISYYDVNGSFKLRGGDIPHCINSQKLQNGRLLWSMSGDKTTSALLKYKNGLEKSIEVVVLSQKENKPLLTEACKELCDRKNNLSSGEASNSRSELTNNISTVLQKQLGKLPEPELSIVFDGPMCTYGLLPWHTGFTEFDSVENSNFFNVKTFANIMYKFSKCEQRFGK